MWSIGYLTDIGIFGMPVSVGAAKSVAPVAPSSGTTKPMPVVGAAVAKAAAPVALPAELSDEELRKLTKEERKAYHQARRAAEVSAVVASDQVPLAKQLTKAQRRELQERQRKVKEDKKEASVDNEELLKELRLQGLSEDQAREVMAEMARGQMEPEDEEEEEQEPEDLLASVRKWIMDQKDIQVTKDALHDFNMKVRFQGHVDTTPPDHIGAILQVLVDDALAGCDLAAPKLQPTTVAKAVQPVVVRWGPLLEPLYEKIDDPLTGADTVLSAVHKGLAAHVEVPETNQAHVMVGSLMALREINMIEDEDLLTGCRRYEPRSRVMDKFIEFLEEALDDEDDDDDEDD